MMTSNDTGLEIDLTGRLTLQAAQASYDELVRMAAGPTRIRIAGDDPIDVAGAQLLLAFQAHVEQAGHPVTYDCTSESVAVQLSRLGLAMERDRLEACNAE